MDDKQKNELYYKLWEFHANLLWNKIQHILTVFAAVFAAWFFLFNASLDDSHAFAFVYLIMNGFLCFFGCTICYFFRKLADRDIEHQEYFEDRLKDVFGELKSQSVNPKKRGRTIFRNILKLCFVSCIALFIVAIIGFYL